MKKHSKETSSDKDYSLSITLVGSDNIEHRIEFLSNLLKLSEDKINHIDQSRQTNLNYALLIFAGLFGLGVGVSDIFYKVVISVAIIVLMIVFCLWDRRLHKISHGWQDSNKTYCEMSIEVINHPSKSVTFPRYSRKSENKAEGFSFQPVIFYLLVVGGIASAFIFMFVK